MSVEQGTSSEPQSALLASQNPQSTGEYFTTFFKRLRAGDLGSLPIIFGFLVICVIFQAGNDNFLTPHNLVNLIVQSAGITAIAYGVTFVLLLGEIDLSVAYVGGVSSVLMTLMLVPTGTTATTWYFALEVIAITLAVAAAIGLFHGLIITIFQVPSFIVTLAGLLGWQGVVLLIIGQGGTILIQDKLVLGIANSYLGQDATKTLVAPELGTIFGLLVVAAFAITQVLQARSRRRYGLKTSPLPIIALQTAGVAVAIFGTVYVCNLDRGVPVVGILLVILLAGLTFLAQSTRFGRYVYAVGGNKEAARRAGIKVERIRVLVFMISSLMAGVGALILASRLRSVDTNTGGGSILLDSIAAAVIGGTSLFGGRGKIWTAVLGALIITGVENGMDLLGLSAGDKFIATGFVLLLAVIVDALSRRSQKQAGLA